MKRLKILAAILFLSLTSFVGLGKAAFADLAPLNEPAGTYHHVNDYKWALYNLFSPTHIIIAAVVLVVVIISVIILFKMRKRK
jgi:hypothetical protein